MKRSSSHSLAAKEPRQRKTSRPHPSASCAHPRSPPRAENPTALRPRGRFRQLPDGRRDPQGPVGYPTDTYAHNGNEDLDRLQREHPDWSTQLVANGRGSEVTAHRRDGQGGLVSLFAPTLSELEAKLRGDRRAAESKIGRSVGRRQIHKPRDDIAPPGSPGRFPGRGPLRTVRATRRGTRLKQAASALRVEVRVSCAGGRGAPAGRMRARGGSGHRRLGLVCRG